VVRGRRARQCARPRSLYASRCGGEA
jgi:hypothetical protein